ncbi:MAG: diguanylate cyclase response regulator [Phycisphaerae bacterium]|nr:diguanylate cyclase response regulator [Phycisphaerae bacterium]
MIELEDPLSMSETMNAKQDNTTSTPPPRPTPRMLVIDDSELIHRLLKVRLQYERIDIRCARDSKNGLECSRSFEPDVILLDIEMGPTDPMDGFAILSELKSDPATRDIPVIFISASTETMDRVRALELGAIDFVCKPFEVVELKARIRSALRVRSLVRMLSQKAKIDGLTGLWNRSYFDSKMEEEICSAGRHGRPLSLIMCDLDRFKDLNDRHGHPFGDLVLERFAQLLSSGRTSDIACRYGGEEFAIILPDTDRKQALQAAERIRYALEQETWPGHDGLVVTGSFGLSQYHVDLDSVKMVTCADQALYRAKELGRNRVEFSQRIETEKLVA